MLANFLTLLTVTCNNTCLNGFIAKIKKVKKKKVSCL